MEVVGSWGRVVVVGPSGAVVADFALAGSAGGCDRPDLGTVDRLARLQLCARRFGGSMRLVDACDDLLDLLELCGLHRQVGGEPEGGEEVGVEEGVEPGDPPA